jgi:hypothetical protein
MAAPLRYQMLKSDSNKMEGMRPLKAVVALVKDEPLNIDERIERLELETGRKLDQFEEALGVFKDVVVKLYEEKEQLKDENESLKGSVAKTASDVKNAIIKPLADVGEGFVELLMENGGSQKSEPKVIGNQNHVAFNPNTDEMERTIKWMREKFGLPSKTKPVQAKSKKKRK